MRTPLAGQNVIHNKVRTAASLSGVTFAIILIFMQLGFYDVCFRSSTMIYDLLDFDLALASPQYVHLRAPNSIPRRRLSQAKQIAGVASAVPIYMANGIYRNPESRTQREMVVIGVDPSQQPFQLPELKENLPKLKRDDTAIMDIKTGKGYDRPTPGMFTELENRKIEVVGTYGYGVGFIGEASIVISDRTLTRLFNGYPLEMVSLGLVKLAPGADADAVTRQLEAMLPPDIKVWKRADLETKEQNFFVRQRPLGIMFSSGVFLALAVGSVILYQILASEIMNKLKEYATLKAIGYSNLFMNKIVLQQSAFFALLGFVPATLLAIVLYRVSRHVTNLPMEMTWSRVVFVLALSVVMCSVSGILVSRKVARTDPADLF
ncbi:MAG: FtsX-like permease family protein [Gemmataceae bacterium]|nr:FtsX-like permease family protein [Gemmataceae bacterium]